MRIKEKIKEKGYLLADGATGTNLFDMGLESGYPPELWNLEHPDRVKSNHQSFLEAGSDILLTNSFGVNEFRLSLHGDEDKADQCRNAWGDGEERKEIDERGEIEDIERGEKIKEKSCDYVNE